ncbi:MAG: ribonuclease R [Gemmatimonadota bacterium]
MTDAPTTDQQILSYLREESTRPLTADELAVDLEVPEEGRGAFEGTLAELEEQGLVIRQRKGRYAVPERLNLAVGRLQVTRGGDGFVNTETGEDDVFVPERHLGTAVEGDVVVARVERRPSGKNPQGRIIRVLRRAWSQVVGIYHRTRNYGFVKAQEPEIRKDLFVPPGFEDDAEDGEVVVVEVLDWGEEEPNPVGRVSEVLGRPGEPGVDVLSILHGHGLPLEFPPSVVEDAERTADWGIEPEDLEGREDFRDVLAFTIDPPDAEDHDDALSVRELDEGEYEVGVHIADVGFYVRPGSDLDREALERGTSVYLVDRVVPMLPEALSAGLCSLVPDEDRLAMSVVFRMDGGGGVRDSRVVRSVVRSDHRLSYDEAHELSEGGREGPDGLARAIRRLRKISRGIRRRREARGSIDFDLPESRVVLNQAGEPTDIQRVLRRPTHRLIEDLMILANETVARRALEEEVPILFRVHEEPDDEKMQQLRELAASFGHPLPTRNVSPKDLAEMVRAMEDTPQEQLVNTATLRSMQKAVYSPENVGHFGLASESYAHFTSPIRRYPDLVVHRQMARWLDDPEKARSADEAELEQIAAHCSDRERVAQEAERDSVDLKKIEFMERHLGEEFDGTIAGVTAFGFFVLLDEYHVEGLVHVSTLTDDYYVFLEEQHAMLGRKKRRKFQLGDRVRVQVARVDREAREIDFELLEAEED